MKTKECPICSAPMKRNGFTSSGRQRWRCTRCGKSEVHTRDSAPQRLEEFLRWLFDSVHPPGPALAAEGPLSRTNNRIEGGVNTQLRALRREHRRMSELRRVKAVFWWCCMHTECPMGAPDLLREMPTDVDIQLLLTTPTRSIPGGTTAVPSGVAGRCGRSSTTRRLTRIPSIRVWTHILSYKP